MYNDSLWKKVESFVGKGKVGICDLVEKFDLVADMGITKYTKIAIIARIHLSKFDNSSFQDRLFFTASNTMSTKQKNMKLDVLKMHT